MVELKVVSVRVDDETMRRMDSYRDVDWSEVVRRAIRARVEVEERMRRRIDIGYYPRLQ